VEAQVLEQHDLAGLSLPRRRRPRRPGRRSRRGTHRLAEQLLQLGRDRLQGELGDLLAVRAAEVRHQHHRRALLEGVLDRRQRGTMRWLLVMAPVALSCGTLKSTRMSTRLPARLRSRMDLNLAWGRK
jgi:hypothetical protein